MLRFSTAPSVEVEPLASDPVDRLYRQTYYPSSGGPTSQGTVTAPPLSTDPVDALYRRSVAQPKPYDAVLGGRSAASPAPPPPSPPPRINPERLARAAAPLAVRALGVANAAATAVSLQGLSEQVEGFALDRATYLPQPVRDFLRRSPDNNPLNPGNYLNYATDRLSRQLFGRLFPNQSRSNDALTAAQPLPEIPPFYGGQSEGILYAVTTVSRQTNEFGHEGGGQKTTQVRGRILGVLYDNGNYFVQSSTQGNVFVEYLNPIFFYNGQPRQYDVSFSVASVTRLDGQPDTGGNPPPAPGSTRPEGQRAPAIGPAPTIAPQINPPRPIPNNPNPAGQAQTKPTPTPAIVPTSAKPSSPLHPKNLSPSKAINPFKSLPDVVPNPVAPAGQAALAPTVTASTAPSSISRPISAASNAGSGLRENETVQDYISRLHNEQLQEFRNATDLGFTNPFENLSNDITERNPATAPQTTSLNPLIPALGVAGLVGAGAAIATRVRPSSLQNTNPTVTGNPSAPVTARPTRQTTSTGTNFPPEFPTVPGSPPSSFCSYDSKNISGKVDQTNASLTGIQLFLQEQVLTKVNSIDSKMGNTALTGGVTGALNTIGNTVNAIQSRVKRTWDFLQIDRILSFLTFITVLHNAYMLSAGLTQTLFSVISTALDATGLDEILGLVDSDDEEVNVSEIVGKLTDSFFKSIFGVENVDGFKKAWKKFNRIYQAATNMLYSIQSMVYSMVEILETISDYTGRIGNALKKSGVVLQNAFNWMNPNANYQNGKFFRYLNNIQEGLEVADEIFSEIVSIQDTAREFYDQTEEFNKSVQDAEKLISDAEDKNKNDSTRPLMTISRQDEHKAEEP